MSFENVRALKRELIELRSRAEKAEARARELAAKLDNALSVSPDARGKMMVIEATARAEKAEAKVKDLEAKLEAALSIPPDARGKMMVLDAVERAEKAEAKVKELEAKVQTEHELYLAAHRLTMELATKNVELTKCLRLKNGSK